MAATSEMRTLYNLCYALWLWVRAPLGLLQLGRDGERRAVFSQRMGRFRAKTKQALTNRQMLWMHGSSREALNLCTRLIHVLEPRATFFKIVVSTGSSLGMERLRRLLPNQVERIFLPFDLRRAVQRSLNVIHPEVMVFLEPVLRPNLIWRLRQRRIPALLVTGRLSLARYRRYRRLGPLARPWFSDLAGVAVPDAETASQLRELGCRSDRIHVVGSWPDGPLALSERRTVVVLDLLNRVGVGSDATMLLGSGTQAGDEQMLAEVFLRLRARHSHLFLGLIPSRYQRGKEVGQILKQLGIRYVYRTAVTAAMHMPPRSVECLVVNARGESACFEDQAAIVVAGRSLTERGHEDTLAAMATGKPVVFGPGPLEPGTMAAALVSAGGARQARDAAELEAILNGFIEDTTLARNLTHRAQATVEAHRGGLDRVADLILNQAREDSGS
jgi:3-deoxy-D-manno-octulosonic-acid transferase